MELYSVLNKNKIDVTRNAIFLQELQCQQRDSGIELALLVLTLKLTLKG